MRGSRMMCCSSARPRPARRAPGSTMTSKISVISVISVISARSPQDAERHQRQRLPVPEQAYRCGERGYGPPSRIVREQRPGAQRAGAGTELLADCLVDAAARGIDHDVHVL